MSMPEPLDLKRIKVYPLAQRSSLSSIDQILVDPSGKPAPCPPEISPLLRDGVENIVSARKRDAGVILMYGAHLIKNGAMGIVIKMIEGGWVTHLATNGAGTIHDWELAFQ